LAGAVWDSLVLPHYGIGLFIAQVELEEVAP